MKKKKITVVTEWLEPTIVKPLQSFLGFRVGASFSTVATSLSDLLKGS